MYNFPRRSHGEITSDHDVMMVVESLQVYERNDLPVSLPRTRLGKVTV